MAGPGPPTGWERPPSSESCKSRRSRSARGSAIWGSMWLEGRRLLLLRLGSRLTSSRPTGALLDPWVPTAFYPGPGILAGPALQGYLDLSPALARAEVRAGECTLQRLRPVLRDRAWEEQALCRSGPGRRRERAGNANGSLVSCFLLSCKNFKGLRAALSFSSPPPTIPGEGQENCSLWRPDASAGRVG